MPASVIPYTGLNLGPVGAISQTDFPLVKARLVKATDTNNLNFGDPAVLNTDNTYSSVAQFIANGGTLTATVPLGIAMADVKTNPYFPLAGGTAMAAGYYAPGNEADVLLRGTINIKVNVGTTATAGGTVYIRKTANGSIPAGVVGGFEAAADGTNTVALTNIVFTTGIIVADGTAQVTILNRQMA